MRHVIVAALSLLLAAAGLLLWGVHRDQARQAAEMAELRGDIAKLTDAVQTASALRSAPAPSIVAIAPAASPPPPVAAAEPDDAKAAPARSPEQQQAIDAAHALVTTVIQSGRLRQEDGAELRRLAQLSGNDPAFGEVVRELMVAANKGKLRFEGNPALLLP